MGRVCLFLMTCILFYFLSSPVHADDLSVQDELKAMKVQMQDMQEKMAHLEEKVSNQQADKQVYEDRIKNLEEQLAEKQTVAEPAASGRSTPIKWTPEIGAMADTVFTSSSTKEDTEGANRLSLRELELILGSNVDPFSRLDAVISFSDSEDPSLEEAYMTRFGLPLNATARLGKFKPKVGKVLGAHRDSLDTVDEPLVIQRYFGVEGMGKSGLDLTAPIDLPWPVTQQLTVGVLEGGNGDSGTAFGTARRAPTLYSHLKNYLDLTDVTGLELGLSHMAGSGGDEPGFDVQVLGADMTLTQHLGTQTIKWQNEVFNLNRRKSVDVDGNLWGAYGLLDYHFLPQWSLGFRYDYAQLVDNPAANPHNADAGESGYLTFYQSEFARWRAQYKHTNLATGKDDNTVYVQGTFVIGDHKHKLQ